MDLAQALKELGRHRAWLMGGIAVAILAALATAYSIHFFPPSLEKKSYNTGSASTQFLVDYGGTPALTDLGQDTSPLTSRAAIYARFMTSAPVLQAISRLSNLPGYKIVAKGPDANEPVANQEPPAEERASNLRAEAQPYRLFFDVQPDLPIVRVFAEAPTADEALALANASPQALKSVVDSASADARVPGFRRVAVKQLGRAGGGSVTAQSTSFATALLAFLGTFIGACIVILIGSSLVRAVRQPPTAAIVPVRAPDAQTDPAARARDKMVMR